MGNRDVVQDDVESQGPSCQVLSDESGDLERSTGFSFKNVQKEACSAPYHFTLGDQLARIELGDNTFQDFIYDRW
jgi:hypothetical protein